VGKYMDIFMLNYLITDRKSFGYYSLATIFIVGLNYIIQTVQTISLPYFSEKSDNKKEFLRVLYKYQKLMIIFSLVGVIIANIAVPPFISLLYSNKYLPVLPFFHILTLKFFFEAVSSLLPQAIFGLGFIKINSMIGPMVLILSMIFNLIFIKKFGIIGAAWAQVSTYLVVTISIYMMMRWCIKTKWQ
jgi:O-antigen/teichoic acid export membrane protein